MRICIVAGSFPKLSETFVINQVLGLFARGHYVEVLCRHVSEEVTFDVPAAQRLRACVRHWWGPAAALNVVVSSLPGKWEDKVTAGLDRLYASRLREFDVVIAHFGHNGSRVARAMKRMENRPPVITIFHGNDVGTVSHGGDFVERYRHLFFQGKLNLTVNSRFRDVLIEGGAPAARTVVHHMGIELESIPFSGRDWQRRPLSFLTVARLTEKKGVKYALEALATFQKRRPEIDWKYRIVGDGELKADLQHLAQDLGLVDRVHFMGPQPHDTVRQLLRTSQVFLLPSITAANGDVEGIPVSLMEAMASGTIAISTFHSGIPELIEDGVSGYLAPERDADALADKLDRVASQPEVLSGIAEAARRQIEREFNFDLQMDLLERRILDAVDDSSNRAGRS